MYACREWGCLRVLRARGRLGPIRLPSYGSRQLYDRALTHPPTVLPASHEVLLRARLLGKGHRQLLSHSERQDDGLWQRTTQTPKAVGGYLEGPHLVDREQERPSVKTRVEVVERPSVTYQLVGVRQDLLRLSRLALVAIIGVPVHLRYDGVDVVIGYL